MVRPPVRSPRARRSRSIESWLVIASAFTFSPRTLKQGLLPSLPYPPSILRRNEGELAVVGDDVCEEGGDAGWIAALCSGRVVGGRTHRRRWLGRCKLKGALLHAVRVKRALAHNVDYTHRGVIKMASPSRRARGRSRGRVHIPALRVARRVLVATTSPRHPLRRRNMPARVAFTLDTLQSEIPKIFDQVQATSANHQKNLVALYKLQSEAAKITESVQNGKSIKLVGERAFEDMLLTCLSRAMPVKKGATVADRVIKFVGGFTKFINEKGVC